MARKINLLWLDDDLRPRSDGNTPERALLQIWLRWFFTEDRPGRINLIEARTFQNFVQIVRERHDLPPDNERYIDAWLIDIMWRKASWVPETFQAIEFNEVNLVPTSAGAQLLGLLLNPEHAGRRPHWFEAYGNRRIATLSSLTDSKYALETQIDERVRERVTVLEKQTEGLVSSSHMPPPSSEFIMWMTSLKVSE